MKKQFSTSIGLGMIIDFDDYQVEIYKSINNSPNCIKYINKLTNSCTNTPYCFHIDWDSESDGGKLTLKHRDKWGSEMIFIHHAPSDLKGMFDFIGKGYNVFKSLNI